MYVDTLNYVHVVDRKAICMFENGNPRQHLLDRIPYIECRAASFDLNSAHALVPFKSTGSMHDLCIINFRRHRFLGSSSLETCWLWIDRGTTLHTIGDSVVV